MEEDTNAQGAGLISPEEFLKLKDTVSGLRGSMRQVKEERDAATRREQELAAENERLKQQFSQFSEQVNQLMKVIPELTARARQAQRLDMLSEHPELLTVKSLKKLILSVDLPDEDLQELLGEVSTELKGFILGDEEEEEEGSAESVKKEPAESAAAKEGDGAEPSESQATDAAKVAAGQGSGETASTPSAETPDDTGQTGTATETPQVPEGPPPVNSAFLDGPNNSYQTQLDEAMRAGNMEAVERILLEHVMPGVKLPNLESLTP